MTLYLHVSLTHADNSYADLHSCIVVPGLGGERIMRRERSDLAGRGYGVSPLLLRKLEELDTIRKRKPLLSASLKSKSTTLATALHLRLLLHSRLSPAFHALQLFSPSDPRHLSVPALVSLTHCTHCGANSLSLLTSSSRERSSPGLREKVRGVLLAEGKGPIAIATHYVPRNSGEHLEGLENLSAIPYESFHSRWEDRSASLLPEVYPVAKHTRKKSATSTRLLSGMEKVKKTIRTRLQAAFDTIYVALLPKGTGKEQSLVFEFSDEVERRGGGRLKGEKLHSFSLIEPSGFRMHESFVSDDHLLRSIEIGSDSVLTASNGAAVVLLVSRLEKAVIHRLLLFFEQLSVF